MSQDEQQKAANTSDEKKDGDKTNQSSGILSGKDTQTGLTQQFGKPIVDRKEESLEKRVESIQNQYQQLKSYKHLAVSGISSAFGDLLGPSPGTKEEVDSNSLDDLLNSGTHKTASKPEEDKAD